MEYNIKINKVEGSEDMVSVKVIEKETCEVMEFETNKDNVFKRLDEILSHRIDFFHDKL